MNSEPNSPPQASKPKMSRAKSEVLDAAAEVFMTLGAEAASIDDVARHLGATKGRIYHHFPSKGVLLAEVCLRAADFAHRAVHPVLDPDLPPDVQLRQMVCAHIPAVLGSLPYHKVILQSFVGMSQKSTTALERSLLADIRQERKAYETLFRDVISRGMACGAFRSQNISVALHSVLLMVNAPVFWYQPRAEDSTDFMTDLSEQLADMAVAALQ
ncbi:TetR/AcrR family transcriptional regulator [Shimia marina]|nr:TetR/AcrR family transcriptional regulator [Shimia marina]